MVMDPALLWRATLTLHLPTSPLTLPRSTAAKRVYTINTKSPELKPHNFSFAEEQKKRKKKGFLC